MDEEQPKEINVPPELEIFQTRFESLESHISDLLEQINARNAALDKMNQNFFNSVKENETIKSNLVVVNQSNADGRSELLDLKDYINGLIEAGTEMDNDLLLEKIDSIISKFESKDVKHEIIKKAELHETVELESKIMKYKNNVSCLEAKNEILNKIVQSKNDYIDIQSKFIDAAKEKLESVHTSFVKELEAQRNLNDSLNSEITQLKNRNEEYENMLKQSGDEIQDLSKKLDDSCRNFSILKQDHENLVQASKIEKEKFILEIEELKNLFEKSKSDILEKYLEQFYPNITKISQMFDQKFSICELYSRFLETQNLNKNLAIEKSVLEGRVESMILESEQMKINVDRFMDEIQKLKQFENRVLKLENENKELNISLKFYLNSAHNLYNGAKVFHENFLNLSDKIKQLVNHETNQVNEDSTGMMALKYIMELQNNFKEFQKLQTEFERQKIDFINEKQNIIESENAIEKLENKILIFESERRQLLSQNEILENEYSMLSTIYNNLKSNSENQMLELKKIIDDLKSKVDSEEVKNEKLKSELDSTTVQIESLQKVNDDINSKLKIAVKQNEFYCKRQSLQAELISRLEKSLDSCRKQQERLLQSKDQFEARLKLAEDQNRELKNKIAINDSQASAFKLEVDILKEREKFLMERLESVHKAASKQDGLDSILKCLEENKYSIDKNLIKEMEKYRQEKEFLAKQYQEKEAELATQKSTFSEKLVKLQTDLGSQMNRNTELHKELMRILSVLNDCDNSNNNPETEKFQLQITELSTQNSQLNSELDDLRQKWLQCTSENLSLVNQQYQMESQLASLNEEKTKLVSDMENLKNDSQSQISQLEAKFQSDLQQQRMNYEVLDSQLQTKNSTCEFYEKKIALLNNTIDGLKAKLDEFQYDQGELFMVKFRLETTQRELETLQKQYSEEKQTLEQTKKKMNEYQNRYIQSETFKIEQETRFQNELDEIRKDYGKLQKEHETLVQSNETLKTLNQELCSSVNRLTNRLKNNQLITNEELSSQISTVNTFVKNLTTENKFLTGKYKLFCTKENRLNEEIQALKGTIVNLESRLRKEKENAECMKELIQMEKKPDFSEQLTINIEKLRQQNNELTRKCDSQQSIIENLKKDLNDQIEKNSNKAFEINNAEMEALKIKLKTSENSVSQLNEKLSAITNEKTELQKSLSELSEKLQQQSIEMESLNKELSSNSNQAQKYLDESNECKQKSAQEAANLNKKIESLQGQIKSLQSTNSQLKILARKYKFQCDEYKKQIDNPEASVSENEPNELESKVQNLTTQNEELQAQVEKLNQDNQKLNSQIDESAKEKKDLAQRVKQEIVNLKKLIQIRDNEIRMLRTNFDAAQTVNVSASPKAIKKTYVSSTIVSASSQQPSTSSFEPRLFLQSNIQPSSSNEDNDRLQSAQITSHTTSIGDENSLEAFLQNQVTESNASSLKRRFSNTFPDQDIKRKREDGDEQNEMKQNDDSTDTSEATQNSNEENNSANAEDVDQSNQEQTESNDGSQASSSDFQTHLVPRDFTQPSTSGHSHVPQTSSAMDTTTSSTINPPPTLIITRPNAEYETIADDPSSEPQLFVPEQPETISSPRMMIHLADGNEEGDGIVPSTPVLFPHTQRFGNSSPQSLQSQFLFIHANANLNSTGGGNTPEDSTTPTFSETISSLISMDEFDSTNPLGRDDANSSMPSSSDSVSQVEQPTAEQPQQQDQNNGNQSGNVHRARKLKIRGSSSRS